MRTVHRTILYPMDCRNVLKAPCSHSSIMNTLFARIEDSFTWTVSRSVHAYSVHLPLTYSASMLITPNTALFRIRIPPRI